MPVKHWERFEADVADALGGFRTPGSGNGWAKGDIKTPKYLIECKETSLETMTFQINWLNKIWLEARKEKRIPVLGVELANKQRGFLIQDREPKEVTECYARNISLREIPYGLGVKVGGIIWTWITLEELIEDNVSSADGNSADSKGND